MHIKQITISNFRSFRQQPEIQPFSPTTNVVVGRNGSGKSNLFDAVQFVLLSPRFATLRSEERQALLHEGSGSAAVNAFVEVVFDNSDNRFSLENSDEVVLRRTVGSKKDEFFLQRKRATKQEVQSLLEGAGFSKSNPYFMVQQGKIQSLCLMSDSQRLQLLQQVAGTTLYEDKKRESQIKMDENTQSIEKINSILSDIDQRLNELKGEKEELVVYQTCDRTRKALEYTLYDKELRKARHTLDRLENERTDHLESTANLHEALKETHERIQNAEGELQIKTQSLRRNRRQLQDAEGDKIKIVTLKTKLDLRCQELQEQLMSGKESLQRTEHDLTVLQGQIKTAQDDLSEKEEASKNEQSELQKLLQAKDEVSRKADSLYAKKGRGKQYSTKAERDASLRKQIKEIQAMQQEKQEWLQQQQGSLGNLRRETKTNDERIEATKNELGSKRESMQSIRKTLEDKQKQLHSLMEVRKNTWRKAEELQERLKENRDHMQRAMSDVRKSMPRATSMGIKALQRIVEEERIIVGEQFFGMVMENLRLKDKKFQTCVEVAAQNALFHVIVDTDATAARLMEHLEKRKLGRVTFMPLNRLKVGQNTRYPQSSDVTPLLDMCVEFDDRVARAMEHIFDKKLLAKSAEVASEWSNKVHMDCITLDGDLCSRKGALTGGYLDKSKSRLRAFAAQRTAEREYAKIDEEFSKVDVDAKRAEQEVTNVSQEVSRLQNKQSQLSRLVQTLEGKLASEHSQLSQNKKQVLQIESQAIPPIEREIAAFGSDIARLEDEIGTELTSVLSDTDREQLAELKESLKTLQSKISSQSEKVEDLRSDRQKLESLLEDNLLRRREELRQVFRDDTGGVVSTSVNNLLQQKESELDLQQQNLSEASKDLNEIDAKLEKARGVEEGLKRELIAAKQELDKLKNRDMKHSQSLEEANEKSEKLMSKKSMHIAKRENYMRKIQELGSLPPPKELEQYRDDSINTLESKLEQVNKKLKKYSHVNKKAFDQYVNFNDQRESLLQRKEELDNGAEKVRELVESLDRKKDEAINRTFRGVSKHFADVFKELVPLGAGELIMRTTLDEVADDGDDSDEDTSLITDHKAKKNKPEDPDVSLYRGIGIKVRFSKVGENFIMSQLSGGQKALVALALIFAIQRCDPAPFYIFDELDQALDSTYRQAVANLISRQASNPETPTQFITSTFRPELVAISKNCYGISHQNKVSSIHPMQKNDALRFIANLMHEEEAVGEVSEVKRRDSRKRKSVSEEGSGANTEAKRAANSS
ncbi:unnamed protein product [Cylindrotheca closterium]|uniref:Structural maintenance of chromosomes protein n=1 Tax=Cylindrotheca closterium TaxID=2856 RepID=A0AAD2FFF1_9STRA|nr:unnamed protein product [Cylindrotheca closterium]